MELYSNMHLPIMSGHQPAWAAARDISHASRPMTEQITQPAGTALHSAMAADQGPKAMSARQPYNHGKLSSTVNGKVALQSSYRNTQIRCLCDINVDRGSMLQCEGDGCGVWQHTACLGLSSDALPEHFFCETCTAQRADPYWRVLESSKLMAPARMLPSLHASYQNGVVPPPGQQSIDRVFNLSPANLEPLRRSASHQLQVATVLLKDTVPFRLNWPKNADLRVNNTRLNTGRRNMMHSLGPNGRDEAVNAGNIAITGRNRISLTATDGRAFCLLVMLVVRRSKAEVEALMAPCETPQQAQARVCRVVGSASEDVQVASNIVSLRCPLTGSRVARAGRFGGVDALAGFDLDAFLDMAARTRKWQCPLTMRHACVQQLQNDAFLQGILDRLVAMPDVMEVEVSPEGQWRPANSSHAWMDLEGLPLQSLPKVKPEPGLETAAKQANGAQTDSDSDSELSEGEEMRRAAQAVMASRKRAKPPVIVISDDSDDDVALPAKRSSPTQLRQAASRLLYHPQQASRGQSGQPSAQPQQAHEQRNHLRIRFGGAANSRQGQASGQAAATQSAAAPPAQNGSQWPNNYLRASQASRPPTHAPTGAHAPAPSHAQRALSHSTQAQAGSAFAPPQQTGRSQPQQNAWLTRPGWMRDSSDPGDWLAMLMEGDTDLPNLGGLDSQPQPQLQQQQSRPAPPPQVIELSP
ncbi:hypothetical protein WJX73_004251 [Symbiochloris irregularis]|uniref:SP-RING-type domain-containing protein n=1 Tax=Symbiochloris irregularis TaxID=706552 RepID=A0AAW1P9M3_9CHLO